ncbi:MAG: DNA/RNA non-specific endonuclease [Prevotella sp.]|nr:DNA/RNA non-specific endonuclease [Prevotella sp.]
MKIIKNILLLAAMAATVTLVSCGGGDDDGPVPTTPTDKTTPTGGDDSGIKGNVNANNTDDNRLLQRLEFPKVKGGNSIVIIHKTSTTVYDTDAVNYSVEWDADKKSQRWSCFVMKQGFGGNAKRSDSFMEDPDLAAKYRFSSSQSYYSGSGFTRGHICASADRTFSDEANQQTFYFTNMQPQYYNFNGGSNYDGLWVQMENQVRNWVTKSKGDILYVVKGGTIDNTDQILMRIKGEMIVPRYFYMAILCKNTLGYKALAFWAEHVTTTEPKADLGKHVITIDELEKRTGIDFFCNLPDTEEEKVESKVALNTWGL